MKKMEHRAILCLILAALLFAGLAVYVFRFTTQGHEWATYYFNKHIFSEGHLATGNVYDVNGTLLAGNRNGGIRSYKGYYTRRATAHAVGDPDGAVSTSAESAFRDKLVGYNLLTGTYKAASHGNDVTLTIDKDICLEAYQAMAGRDGCVGVYNYKTGEIICMVSTPTFDPADPPKMSEAKSGTFMNKFLLGTMTPGSIFKLVTSAAAIETYDGLGSWSYNCTGSRTYGNEKITCVSAHGKENFRQALANSCNCGFADLTEKVGAGKMRKYTKKAGLTTSYDIDGIHNAEGTFQFPSYAPMSLAWAGIGQWKDQLNPCSMLVYVSAIATDGSGTVPHIIHSSMNDGDKTDQMIDESTAKRLRRMMRNNVESEYGQYNFPGLKLYAKSGTAELGNGLSNVWFTGFIKNKNYPYAFIVCVENSTGSGASVAGPVANKVLQRLVLTDSAATQE